MNEQFTAKKEIVVNAPPSKVWMALTDPNLVKQYLFGTEMSVTAWEVGGNIKYKGEWQGKNYEDKGTILAIEPEQLLVSTYWSSLSGKPDAPENYQKVSYKIEPATDGTKLTIEQEGNPTPESAEHSGENWAMVLEGLKKVVEKV